MTEEVTGADLVAAQLRLAGGAPLASLNRTPPVRTNGASGLQLRVNRG